MYIFFSNVYTLFPIYFNERWLQLLLSDQSVVESGMMDNIIH